MSNCVELHKYTVDFAPDEIDAKGLQELCEEAEKEVNKENCGDVRLDPNLRCAWWYLSENTTFSQDGVRIEFGHGRSTHTWRDLRWTLKMLSRFVKKPKEHTFLVADEFDNFDCVGPVRVDFLNGRIVQ